MAKRLIMTGWGLPEYAPAAAMLLRCAFKCTAEVMGVSQRHLPIALKKCEETCSEVYVLGVGLGILASYYILQKLVLNSQGKFLTYGAPAPVFLPVPTLIVALGGVLLSVLAVRFACTNLLRLPAIRLMQGSANLSKLQKASGKGTGGLYRRLILLNMRTDSKRVLVTIVSVAGCCILLVVGFYIKFGISSVNDVQFGPEAITRYDAELYYDASEAPDAEEALAKLLKEHKLPAIGVRKEDVVFRPDAAMTAGTLLCAEPDELGDFYALRDAESGAPLALAFKAVSTMDSMVGYKNERYLYFGRAAARLDDAANYLPARISALFWIAAAALTGHDARGAFRIWRRDARKTASPNAGQTESACAGSLGVQLGGPAWYFGQRHEKAVLGDACRPCAAEDILRANRMMLCASVLLLPVCAALRLALAGVL